MYDLTMYDLFTIEILGNLIRMGKSINNKIFQINRTSYIVKL